MIAMIELVLALIIAALVFMQARKARELAITHSQIRKRFAAVSYALNSLPGVAVLVFDGDLRFQFAAGMALPHSGYLPSEMVGRTLYECVPEASVKRLSGIYVDTLAGQSKQVEVDANDRHYRVQTVPIRSGGQTTGGMLFIVDTTAERLGELKQQKLTAQLKKQRERYKRASYTDVLTGAYSRRYMLDRIEQTLADAERHDYPVSVLAIDIDHFKRVNDTLGHAAGDEVLAGVARVMGASVRKADTLARMGGEEFLVLLPRCGYDDALARGESIRAMVAASACGVTVSVGVATWRGEPMGDWLASVDRALYSAKDNGRDRVALSSGTVALRLSEHG